MYPCRQSVKEFLFWIVGFTDGERFSVSYLRIEQASPEFERQKALKPKKNVFSCGNIYVNHRYDNHRETFIALCRKY